MERNDGSEVPYTRGCSFYSPDKQSGLIKTGFKVSEMIVKPSKQFSDSLVSSASKLMQGTDSIQEVKSDTNVIQTNIDSVSIIEQYFEAWNRRDMECALACFVDECNYETEDPVFR